MAARSRVSAGLLMYRRRGGQMEFLLVRPGGPFFLRPQFDLMVNLARPEVQVDGEIVWKTSAVSALVGAALLANLP